MCYHRVAGTRLVHPSLSMCRVSLVSARLSQTRSFAKERQPDPKLFSEADESPSDKAHTLLAQSNFDLAIKFLHRALEVEPANLEAREVLGIAELEGGDEDAGREVSLPPSSGCYSHTDHTFIVSLTRVAPPPPLPASYPFPAISSIALSLPSSNSCRPARGTRVL